MQLAFVSSSGKGSVDSGLATLAERLESSGLRLGGVVQRNVNCTPEGRCDMEVRVLPDGPVIRISQSLGAGARGCRLDTGELERAAGLVQRRLDTGVDLLLVNKFGKHEADGRGFRPVIADALSRDIPVLVGLGALNRAAFEEFAGGDVPELQADPESMLAWVGAVTRTVDVGAPG